MRCIERQETGLPMSPREGRGFRGWASNVLGTLAGIAVMGLVMNGIAYSGYRVWVQHFGIPAQVKIAHCDTRGPGTRYDRCTGVWRQTDGTQRTVTVHGRRIPVRQTVDVHISGDTAFTNSFEGWIAVLLLIPVLGVLLFLVWLGRRQSRRPSWGLALAGAYFGAALVVAVLIWVVAEKLPMSAGR